MMIISILAVFVCLESYCILSRSLLVVTGLTFSWLAAAASVLHFVHAI